MKVKWDTDGKGVTASTGRYAGPDLEKGSYVVKLKRMTIVKIKAKASPNFNKPRINLIMEVCGPDKASEYFGHPIFDGLNIIESGRGYVNAFLHALTDGSDKQKKAIEAAFWPPNGPDAKREKRRNSEETDLHVKKIGPWKIGSPNGELLLQVTAKPDHDLKGAFRAAVTQYLPYQGADNLSSAADDDDFDDDDEDFVVDADEIGGDNDKLISDLDADDDGFVDVVGDDEPPF